MAVLTDQERAKILRYLGYPNWEVAALAWGLSYPRGIMPQYYINDAMDRLTDDALELVRNDVAQLTAIESQMSTARERLKASKVGDITLNPEELSALRGELEHWKKQLADDFGSVMNPYRQSKGGSRCGEVIG